eukprot:scaffold1971_cov374-Prasinococcus_capsulatus_cf.AAC.6
MHSDSLQSLSSQKSLSSWALELGSSSIKLPVASYEFNRTSPRMSMRTTPARFPEQRRELAPPAEERGVSAHPACTRTKSAHVRAW